MKRVSFHTIGCRLNQAETAVLADRLKGKGYQPVPFGSPTDLLVVNTCSVTEGAEADCRSIVRRTLRCSPNAVIAVTGCYAQTGREVLEKVPGIDVILGNQFKMDLADLVSEGPDLVKRPKPVVVHSRTLDRDEFTQEGVGEYVTTRANLKIQDGCNFMCSFCLIPFARGRERSRQFDDVLREAESLVGRGHRELVLTGVNIGRFATKAGTLIDLLSKLEAIPGLDRIRISSIEPTTVPDALVDYMAESKKLCRFLHVPLQSGDDGVLKSMNRHYAVKDYLALIHRFVARIPDLCVGTDLMVGYPGETESQFANTADVFREGPFAYCHVFSFSSRPGTPAAKAHHPVSKAVIKARSERLSQLSGLKRLGFYRQFLDRQVSVLFECQNSSGLWTGLTDNFIRVGVQSSTSLANQVRDVKIGGVTDGLALGRLVDREGMVVPRAELPLVAPEMISSR